MRKDDTDYKITAFRQSIHKTFCGKLNEDDACPGRCPANKNVLKPSTWGKMKISDILEVKK